MSQTEELLQGISVQAALRLAVARSGKSDDEIGAEMGWSPSVTARILKNMNYWPSFPSLPDLCRVLGNTTLIRWALLNVNAVELQNRPMDAIALLSSMGALFAEMGALAAEGQKALEDHHIDPNEARRLLRRLRAIFDVGCDMVPRLQATIDAEK